MAAEEVSSLLLRVGVDYAAIEELVTALPEIATVAEQVGQALNATQIGNPALFAQKGAALGRAITTGFLAEIGGVSFSGAGGLAGVLTRQVFGDLDTAQFQRYAQQIQSVINGLNTSQVRSILPPDLGRQLRDLSTNANGAISVVDRLQDSLNRLGRTYGEVQRAGQREYRVNAPNAQYVIERPDPKGQFQLYGPTPRGGNADPDATFRTLKDAVGTIQRQSVEVLRAIGPSAQAALPAAATPVVARVAEQQVAASSQRAADNIDRAARAMERAAVRLEQVVFTAGKRDQYGDQVFYANERGTRQGVPGRDLGFMKTSVGGSNFSQIEGIAVQPEFRGQGIATELFRFAQQFRRDEARRTGVDPFINQIIHDPSRTEDGERFARRAGGFAAGYDAAGRRGLNLMTPFGELPFPDAALPNYARRNFFGQRELPPGTGRGPIDFVAQARQDALEDRRAQRLVQIAARRDLELLDDQDPFGRGSVGLDGRRVTFGRPLNTAPVQSSPDTLVRARDLTNFQRSMNEDILRGLDSRLKSEGLTANTADTTPDSLRRALGAAAYDRMILGGGLGPKERLRLTEEQREALGDINAVRPSGRLFPPMLVTRDVARAQFQDPSQPGALTLASRVDLENTRRAQQALEFEARAARDLSRELGLLNSRLAITSGPLGAARGRLLAAAEGTRGFDPIALEPGNAAGGIPGAPPLTRGAPPSVNPADVLAAKLRAAGATEAQVQEVLGRAAAVEQSGAFRGVTPGTAFLGTNSVARPGELPFNAPPTPSLRESLAAGVAPLVAQRTAEVTYLRNIAATRRLDEALARLQVQLEQTARSAATAAVPLAITSSLLGLGRGPSFPISGLLDARPGIGSAVDPRLQDAIAALSPRGAVPLAGRGLLGAQARGFEPPFRFPPDVRLPGFRTGDPMGPFGPFPAGDPFYGPYAGSFGGGAGGRPPGGVGGGVGGGGFGPPPPPPPGTPGGGPGGFRRARDFARSQFENEDTFLGGVRRGFTGGDEGGAPFFGRSVGSAARFALVYGAAYSALRLFTTAFGEGVRGAIEFETALTDLNIATERTGRSNEAFAFSLSNLGAGRGFAPGESVQAGARAIGLFGATDAPRVDQEEIARVSTDVATQIAFISGQTLEQVQTQLAGITRSFNVDPLDQSRIFDVASFVGRRSGRPAGELLQSLGQIGSLGGDAGFSLEQTAAIIARLTSTTGQTPQAVSGFLSQVLSRADDPRLQSRLRAVGVNTQGTTLAEQIEQLSTLDLDQAQKNQIVAGFGRGRSGQALGIILEQFPEIQALAQGAAGAQGLGEEDFNQAVNTVGGQLRVLGSSLKDLFTGLASSGILDVFVLLLSAAQGLVDALDAVVDVFNLIPREARSAAFMLLEVYGALLLLSRLGPVASRVVAATGLQQVIDLDGTERLDGTRAQRARGVLAAGRAGLTSGLTRLGGTAAGGLLGGGALAGGLLAGAGAAAALVGVGIWKAFAEAAAVDRDILEARQSVFGASSEEDFAAAKNDLAEARKAVEERDDFKLFSKDAFTFGVANLIDDIMGVGTSQRAELDALEAERVEREEAVAEARKQAIDTSPGAVFDGFAAGPESVSQGLAELTENGFSATRQLAALNQAFDAMVAKSDQARGAVGVIFAGQFDAFNIEANSAFTNTGNDFASRLAQGNPLLAGGRARELLIEQNPLSLLLSPFAALAGGAGAAAGASGNFFTQRIPAFFRGTGSAFTDLVDEFNPLVENSRERSERNRRGASEIERVLGDTGVQEQLSGAVTDVLRSRGKDPSLGPVVLTAADKDAITARRKQILEENLGKPFDKLDQETKDAFYADLEKSFTDTLAAFNGEKVTAETAAAFLQGVRQTAGAAGEERALTTGDQVAGAALTTQSLREARAKAAAVLTDSTASEADRTAATRLLELIDLDILRATQNEVQKRNQRVDSLAALASSRFGGDPLQTALINIAAIQAKLATATDVDERTRLEAELNTQGFAVLRAQAASVSSFERAGLDPRDATGNAEAAVRDAQRQVATQVPGTQGYYDAIRRLRESQLALADVELREAQAALFVGLGVQDEVGRADAALKAARLKRESLSKPLPTAGALNDFDTAGNEVGSVDLPSKGKGIGQQVIDGLLSNNYRGAGANAARAILEGFASAAVPGGTNPAAPGYTPAPKTPTQAAFGDAAARVSQADADIKRITGQLNDPDLTGNQARRLQADLEAAKKRLAAAKADLAAAAAAASTATATQATYSPGTAVLPGRQGSVLTGGSFATSGPLAPKPGQLTLGNRPLIDLIVGSGAAFGRLDGNIVPRRTADGGISSHSFGNALDIFGTPEELAALVKQLTPLAGRGLKELIYTPTGTFLGKGGREFTPSKNVRANHRDHIHAQVDDPEAVRRAAAAAGITLPAQVSAADVQAADEEIARRERERVLAIQARDIAKLNSTLNPANSLDRARADLRIANRILRDASGDKNSREYYEALTQVNQAKLALARAELARAQARDNSEAVRAGSAVAAAASRLRNARAQLANEVPRTKEYYDALAAVYQAQRELAEANRQAASIDLQLASDITDPVAQAAIALRVALRKAREVRKDGSDQDVIDEADLAVRQAQTSLEQAAFDQAFNRARVDAELGRTSQQSYLTFLMNEKARLEAIKDRTVQQQAQLDQVDQALKGLNDQLSGQFNLGEIEVPTVYDARRALAGGLDPAAMQARAGFNSGSLAGGSMTTYNQQSTVTITINGGDVDAVKTVLSQYLGASALGRTSVSTAKV